ncbi:hypothetical protein [Falsiroseomonas selenitidurans]|uniref:Uncharacterized protein n=1 Tax=Falsiroseomonas selenitidurans TaxID=2716335 RepID=A0ABX1DX04_9PROT|nr:hypothetical protein [Falsiroseomonas selenitidurans]NKC29433.1 hypothetical protein [Falsiroseomonas selenitidurans]
MTGAIDSLSIRRLSQRRVAEEQGQALWIAFGGVADQPWLHLLRPGFRHCFAALSDEAGWTVVEPLSGRLLVARLPVEAGFDLPDFYRRAGLRVLGPFRPEGPAMGPAPRRWPVLVPLTCVGLCRALLGTAAPAAWTPWQLFQALGGQIEENNQ